MIYLSSPYTHIYPEVMQARYEFTMEITAYLIKLNYVIFSPIVHCHVLAEQHNLPKDFIFWQSYNESVIDSCSGFMIAVIAGWSKSIGVHSEYEFAVAEGKPISMITPLFAGKYEITDELSMNPFPKEIIMNTSYIDRSKDEEIIDIVRSVMDNGTGKAETANEHILIKLMQLRNTPMTSFKFDQEQVNFHYNQWIENPCK